MKNIHALIGGFVGAIALNAVHEIAHRLDPQAPRIDKVGEEAIEKSAEAIGIPTPKGNGLYMATLTGDLMSNSLYYSAIGIGDPKSLWKKAIAVGITAGIGALQAPKVLGLSDKPVTHSSRTKVFVVGFYLLGAIASAATISCLAKRPRKSTI